MLNFPEERGLNMNYDLLQALRELYLIREDSLAKEFNRSLSFADAILDNRWTRAKKLGFSQGVSIYDSALVYGHVEVGEQTWIGPNVILDGTGGGIKVGSFCSIAAGVHIYTHDTVLWAVSGGKAPFRKSPVKVGDCCHIGAQAIILPGVEIGGASVVAANSLVNKDVPNNSVVAGSPARIIGRVDGSGADIQLHIDGPIYDPL